MIIKKVAITVLIALVLLATCTFLNPTLALTTEPQKQKAEALFSILDNNNMSIMLAFSKLDAQNITVPNAKTAYNEGLATSKEAASLMNQENFSEACNEAIEAMQKFEEVLRLLETVSPVEPTKTEVTAEETISLKANITRTIEHVERLENLTAKAASAGYNTTAIEKLLEEAKQHLENATRELRAMNLEKAIEEFSIAQGLLDELKGYMNNLTNLVTESNTEQYLQEAKKRVSAAKANITQSVTLTPKAKEDAITALNNSEISLANARDQIEENNVDEAIEELEDAKKWEEESDRTISAVAATPNSVAPTTDRGSTTNESLTPTNENATRPKITATE